VTGRTRHILIDTIGLLLTVTVHPADVQDRDGARLLLAGLTDRRRSDRSRRPVRRELGRLPLGPLQ